MSITTVKALRTISKIVLLVVGIGIIGYGGLMIYKSVVNKPQRVRITNVTDSAATITWVTDNPVRGVVYYKDEGSFLPGPLGLIGSKVAYDDRDFAKAQDECVKAFNENANITKDANFTVDGSGFDCENIPVEKLGAYYTHSVTIKNLNESSTYFFIVGNGIWSWSVDDVDKDISENDLAVTNSFNFKTSQLLEEVPTPNIAYGTVYAGVKSEEGYLSESLSKDSLVFAYLTINGVNSQIISAVTNTDGGWTFDKSNFRDAEGNLITDLSKAKMMVRAQYEDVEDARWVEIEEDLDSDTEMDLQGNLVDDLNEAEKSKIKEKFEILMRKVYAIDDTEGAFTDCGSLGVDGCNGDASKCVKKCYVPGTENFKWVQEGTVGSGNCSLPLSCGCTPGTCEENCSSGQRRTCMSGHYWSVWVNGQCSPSGCGGGGGGVDEGNDGEGGGDPCDGIVHNACNSQKTKKCVKDDDNKWHLVTVVYPATQCATGDGTTGDPRLGGSCSELNKCVNVPPYKNGFICTGTIGNLVWQTHSGSCPVNDVQCKAVPKYSHYTAQNCEVYQLSGCDFKCGDGSSTFYSSSNCINLFGMNSGYSDCGVSNVDPNKDIVVNVNEIDFSSISFTALRKLLSGDTTGAVAKRMKSEMDGILAKYNGTNLTCNNQLTANNNDWNRVATYCSYLGKKLVKDESSKVLCMGNNGNFYAYGYTCSDSNSMKMDFFPKVYAEESTSSGYTLYLPEYGMYSFELGDYKLTTSTTNGNTYYIFYVEANDKAGFQMPADPDHPTEKEDIMLKSDSVQIQHKKVASAQSYTLVKGINLVSFNFIPVAGNLGPLTAKGIITEAAKKGVTIQYISSFEGGRWAKGYTCKNTKCSGNDFNIIAGKGYLVYATKGGEMIIPGYSLKSSVPVNLSGGWNLIGIHGYANVYTARTLIDSMNKIDGVTANNVTWWPTSKGMYEGLQVTGGKQYGFDFPISPTNGYFVRVSSFKPEDSKCKSLLWNEGGALNGKCGIIK